MDRRTHGKMIMKNYYGGGEPTIRSGMKKYVPRDPIRDYFPLPNEIFRMDLSSNEISVYAYLMYCEDRKTYQCHPAYSTIGQATGLSKNTVMKSVRSLEEKCLITTEPTRITAKNGQIRNGSLLYTILPIENAKEVFDRKQWQIFEQQCAAERARRALEEYDRKHRIPNPAK